MKPKHLIHLFATVVYLAVAWILYCSHLLGEFQWLPTSINGLIVLALAYLQLTAGPAGWRPSTVEIVEVPTGHPGRRTRSTSR